ncbi:hypothetical protein WR25_14041 [Diploscapter pachys]|uniref:G-protein coupled receptors family 1 profile domain-containing protein n=1 Tax=Diploscapter pachys TaxID=2018661 RepID=A0A2A2JHH8_9BILA|nr:hypothetical protein WR25_14041 [Diploscapter pachys]
MVGTIFNSMVIWIAMRYIDTEDKPRQIIVINMTMADLLMCVFYMMTRPWVSSFPNFFCHPYYMTIWTCQLVSCLNLVWLNVDKLVYIQFPLHYYSIVSRVRMLRISTATWLAMFAITVALALTMSANDGCIRLQLNPYLYLSIPLLYVVMIVTSFTLSAIIYCIAQTSTKLESRARSKLFHRLFFLFSSTLWTFFTCLPYRFLYLMGFFCMTCVADSRFRWVTDQFFRLLVVGIVINPLITIWTQRVYRVRVLRLFGKMQKKASESDMLTSVRRLSEKPFEETVPLNTTNRVNI